MSKDEAYDYERLFRSDTSEQAEQALAERRAGNPLWAAMAQRSDHPVEQLVSLAVVAVGIEDGQPYVIGSVEGALTPELLRAVAEIHLRVHESLVRSMAGVEVPLDRRPS